MIFYIRSRGTDDAGQRRAKIVGNGPQEIGAYPFFLCFVQFPFPFCNHLILPGEFGGHGAGGDGNDQHTDKCDRVSAHGKVNLEERVGEAAVDEDNAEQGRKDAVQVSGGPPGNQNEGQDIDQCDVGSVVFHKMKEQERKPCCGGQHEQCV